MGILKKILDFSFTEDWEQYRRVQLYRDIGDAARSMSKDQLVELKKLMDKVNSASKK